MKQTTELEIIYKDDHFVAVNKPSGLMVHRSVVDTKETIFALQTVRNQIGCHVFPVHRLDRPTSGILLFALSPETAKKCAELFKTDQIHKTYLAVVRGYLPDSGTIDHPVKKIKDRYIRRQTRQQTIDPDATSYPAITDFKCLAKAELPIRVDKYPTSRYSLAHLCPQTGRRHQLRQHMKHLSHPIIGDTRYGKSVHNNFFKDQLNCRRLLLAAVEMRFIHPETGNPICLSAAPDHSFADILKKFSWNTGVCDEI